MMLIIFLFLLILLLLLVLKLNDGNILAPSTLFVLGFVLCAGMAALFADIWKYDLSIKAALVVLTGCVLFVLSAWLTHRFMRPMRSNAHAFYIDYNILIIFLFIALQLLTLILTEKAIVRLYPSTSVSASIALYNKASKFSLDGVKSLPFPVGPLRNVCGAYELLLAYFLAQDLVYKRIERLPFLTLSYVLGMALSIQTGGRSNIVGSVFEIVFCYLLILGKARGRSIKITPLMVFFAALGAIVLANTFQASLALLGRPSNSDPLEYLAIYIGAEIPNLDEFINTVGQRPHDVWGYMTFISSIKWLGSKLGISSWIYQLDLPFLTRNGHEMGNVYTTFYALIYDFGYIGLVLTAFMGMVSQFVFEMVARAKKSRWAAAITVIYSRLGYILLMSFFSNWFFETFFSIGMIRTICYLLLINFFLTLGKTCKHVTATPPKRLVFLSSSIKKKSFAMKTTKSIVN